MFQDISSLKLIEADLQRANRLKDEFLATLSHELRTPLNAVLGWARMLRTGQLDGPTSDRAHQTIERNAKAQAQLIEDLLDVSRIISGKLRLNFQTMEPGSTIESAIDALRPAAEAKNVVLQVMLDPRAGPVAGDPDRLQQVVWNLLSNAIKFTPAGGQVRVGLQRVEAGVEICVRQKTTEQAPQESQSTGAIVARTLRSCAYSSRHLAVVGSRRTLGGSRHPGRAGPAGRGPRRADLARWGGVGTGPAALRPILVAWRHDLCRTVVRVLPREVSRHVGVGGGGGARV